MAEKEQEKTDNIQKITYILVGSNDYANTIISKKVEKKLISEGCDVEISLYPKLDGEYLLETLEKIQKYLNVGYKFMLLADLSVETLKEANAEKKCEVNFDLLEDLKI